MNIKVLQSSSLWIVGKIEIAKLAKILRWLPSTIPELAVRLSLCDP